MKYLLLLPNNQAKTYLSQLVYPYLDKDETEVLIGYINPDGSKLKAHEMKAFIHEYLEQLPNIKYLIVADKDWFRGLYGNVKPSSYVGYILDYSGIKLVFIPNPCAAYHAPERTAEQIKLSLEAIKKDENGNYKELGSDLASRVTVLESDEAFCTILESLKDTHKLAIDFETTDVNIERAELVSVALSPSIKKAYAVKLDTNYKIYNLHIFLMEYKGTLIFHNATFDISMYIRHSFMGFNQHWSVLVRGLQILTKSFEDTMIIAYLATNNAAENKLSLKDLAQEFAGNWALEHIDNLNLVDDKQLLIYNGIDTLATWYVYKKYYPIMVKDQQEKIYKEIFKPAIRDIVWMQLCGLPIDMERVKEVKEQLQQIDQQALDQIKNNQVVKSFVQTMREDWVADRNSKLKRKTVTLVDAQHIQFNPNSTLQLKEILYDKLSLPVLSKTKKGSPATDADTLKALRQHTTSPEAISLIDNLLAHAEVDILLTTFIPAFEKAFKGEGDFHYYLAGNFNLGGTVSGRLSSSKPNLQNIPATGTKYAKLIKSIFKPREGELLIGIDFSSLEDRISALTTKDPQKLKVYTDGYDGHCLRSYYYFKDQMPDIDPNSVESINSIKKKYPALRQLSKNYTFACTYQAVPSTLMKNFGATKENAERIYKAFHELYSVSDEWVNKQLKQAEEKGYITTAFGLRVRTNRIKQSVMDTKKTPHEAEAERRTAANALGQAYGLLNSRAASEFLSRVIKAGLENKIRPVAQIHDAQYYLIEDNVDIVLWCNKNLVECVSWQELPEIKHDQVKLGGEVSIFYPDWAHELTLPNDCSEEQLITLVKQHLEKL